MWINFWTDVGNVAFARNDLILNSFSSSGGSSCRALTITLRRLHTVPSLPRIFHSISSNSPILACVEPLSRSRNFNRLMSFHQHVRCLSSSTFEHPHTADQRKLASKSDNQLNGSDVAGRNCPSPARPAPTTTICLANFVAFTTFPAYCSNFPCISRPILPSVRLSG